jgi:lipopolysaccharide biosynthesis protein
MRISVHLADVPAYVSSSQSEEPHLQAYFLAKKEFSDGIRLTAFSILRLYTSQIFVSYWKQRVAQISSFGLHVELGSHIPKSSRPTIYCNVYQIYFVKVN